MKNVKGELLCLDIQGIKPNYSELGRIYGMDRRTVKKYHQNPNPKTSKSKKRKSKLEKYDDIIKEKLNLPGSNKKAVYMYLKTNVDDNIGSYSNFRKYTSKKKDLFKEKDSTIHLRFETEMGKQLQFDWKGPIKMISKNGEVFEFYIFSTTLSASRFHTFIYSKFMTLESVERCLIETFQYINGIPKECLTDNMSSIVNYSQHQFVPEFKAFCRDMGTTPKRCKVDCPETKGKDESCNRFMKWLIPYNNEFESEEELIGIIKKLNEQINLEKNQTTGMPPISLFRKEKEYLEPLPKQTIIDQYLDTMIPAKVSNGLLVYYKGSQYSVPKKYINQTVKLNEIDNKLFIYYNRNLIAMHNISTNKINYNEDHYVEALKATISYKDENDIENIAKNNLKLLNKLTK